MYCMTDNEVGLLWLGLFMFVPLILAGTHWLGYESGLCDGRRKSGKRANRKERAK